MDAQWPQGESARFRIERSGFEPWPEILYYHSASLSTLVYKWVPANLMLGGGGGGYPAMDWHPIQGGVEIFVVASS